MPVRVPIVPAEQVTRARTTDISQTQCTFGVYAPEWMDGYRRGYIGTYLVPLVAEIDFLWWGKDFIQFDGIAGGKRW